MGLANTASNVVREKATAEQDRLRNTLTHAGQSYQGEVERLLTLLGIEGAVVYLDSSQGHHPVRRKSTFGTDIGREYHTLHRVRVDDVVIVDGWDHRHSSKFESALYFAVERICDRCQERAYTRPDYVTWPENLAEPSSYKHPLKVKAEFITKLGKGLTQPVLCWNCEAQVGHDCPTCHRAWTKEGMARA